MYSNSIVVMLFDVFFIKCNISCNLAIWPQMWNKVWIELNSKLNRIELGFIINEEKSAPEPTQRTQFLGALLDFKAGRVFPTQDRVQAIKECAKLITREQAPADASLDASAGANSKLSKSKNCHLILIAPRWPCQMWFTRLLTMIAGEAIALPLWKDLIQTPEGTLLPHQTLKILNLTAWQLSSDHTHRRDFQRRLQLSLERQGDLQPDILTIPVSESPTDGVSNTRLIHIQPLSGKSANSWHGCSLRRKPAPTKLGPAEQP